MKSSRCITILSMSASLALALSAGSAAAQATSLPPPYNSYAAKFACGVATADADVVKGTYATSVNIHNPQSQLPVTFFKKVVQAFQECTGPTCPPPKIVVLNSNEILQPDQAERVDCPLIARALGVTLTTTHVEGFVVIQVPPQPTGTTSIPFLDVVAKYTARTGATGFTVVPYFPTTITR
jgi:hypothetical protein